MPLELRDGDPEALAYPELKFESAWEEACTGYSDLSEVAYLFLVFSGRAFRCDQVLCLCEVESLPSTATPLAFRQDFTSREFERPPARFTGESIAHVAGFCGDDCWIFLEGGHLIKWGIYPQVETLSEANPDDFVFYSTSRFFDDSERSDWPIDLELHDLNPAPIRFLNDRR